MKVINTHQVLAVSGGTPHQVSKYEQFTSMGIATGILGGIVYAISSKKSFITLPVAALIAGPVIGYAAGAVAYHANHLLPRAMDYFLKPAS